jgi:hypothetical protein
MVDGPLVAAQLGCADPVARLTLLASPTLPLTARSSWFVADIPLVGEPAVELVAPHTLLQAVLPRVITNSPGVILRTSQASSLVLQQVEAVDLVLREAFTKTLWATSLRAVMLLGQVRRSGRMRAPSSLVERELAACYAALLPDPQARRQVALAHHAWLQRSAERAHWRRADIDIQDGPVSTLHADAIILPPPTHLRVVGAKLRNYATDRFADTHTRLIARALHIHTVRLTGIGSAGALQCETQALLKISSRE